MAAPTTKDGVELYIKVGNGASPEVFTHPCTINAARGIEFTASTNEVIVPDCANPADPAWVQVVKDGLKATINGEGILDATLANIQLYDTWFTSKEGKNVQVWIAAIGKWVGEFKLTQWAVTGERNDKIQASITLESDGSIAAFAA